MLLVCWLSTEDGLTPDEFDRLWSWIEKLELERSYAKPSPSAARLENAPTNAVFLDGCGNTRPMNLLEFRPEILIPLPRMLVTIMPTEPPRYERMPVAVFRLSSVLDGKAVYRYAGER